MGWFVRPARSSKNKARKRFFTRRYPRLPVKPSILSLSQAALEAWLVANDAPAYRRGQLWGWLARGVSSFQAMHDVPKQLRAALERDFRITSLTPVAASQAGGAQ